MTVGFEGLMRFFRKRRMQQFVETFQITENTRILDVGGTDFNWSLLRVRPRVVLLNMPREEQAGTVWVGGDGRMLPFRDQSFDVVFSNSVIEHVGSQADQRRFADEIVRVGQRYWVQTPNRGFPIEPHLLTPFLHFLPRAAQAWLAPKFTVWAALVRPSEDRREFYVRHYLQDIRLLSRREMQALFPEADVRAERLLGFTKSLIAVRDRRN